MRIYRLAALAYAAVCACVQLALAATPTTDSAPASPSLFSQASAGVQRAWQGGATDYYVPLYTYHLRFAYTQEKIKHYQERPPGFGYGHSYIDENGDERSAFGMIFSDSHFYPEYLAGYSWLTYHALGEHLAVGAGVTAGLTARTDIFHYIPFPYVMPSLALTGGAHSAWTLNATYVPGGIGFGNIIFFSLKWRMSKSS